MLKVKKTAKCKNCGIEFKKFNSMQKVCSIKCSIELAKKDQQNQERKQWAKRKKELREKVMTHKDYLKLLQIAFNTFIRERDKYKGCISCGVDISNVKFDAGHYRSVGAHPALRFDEQNVHGQCVQCNRSFHGNLIEYRKRLLVRIGPPDVERLESDYSTNKLTIPEIQQLTQYYRKKTKRLKQFRKILAENQTLGV